MHILCRREVSHETVAMAKNRNVGEKKIGLGSVVPAHYIIRRQSERQSFLRSHPRVASIRNASTGAHVCGATLVSAYAAVTAAHCMHALPLYLQLNNYCAPGITEPPTAALCDVYIHENYNKYTRAHDLAVLSIDLNLDNKTWLEEDILPKSTFGLSGTCMIAGYGVNDVNSNETSEILRGSFAKIVSLDECTDRLGAFMAPLSHSGMICAVGDCTDACQGDSGGPLICEGVLEGVISYGLSCGVRDVPAVYTGLRGHLSWLRKKISMLNQMNMKI
ncbi:Transmembrane protease serine 13 [Eumeta japonica]|uniref:Transmembrane protease serine 13 n=1 Tax=Eumeta variegata TaxID=151549 RepID=A0A4C1UBC6_EUMVA|nr:Transmembrane protease serine 13 [Eumeta japonica]